MTTKWDEIFVQGLSREWETTGEGVRRKILGYDESLMMTYVEFKRGAIGKVHSHPHTQVTYIESGLFEVLIGDEKKLLGAGDCYFVPPGIEHGVVAMEESRLVDVFTPMRKDFLKPNA